MGGHSGSFLPLWMSHLLSQRPATGVACASGAPLCLGIPRWVSADRPRDVLPPRAFPEPAPEAGPSLGPWQSPGFPPALAAVAPGADSLPWHGRPSGLGHCVRGAILCAVPGPHPLCASSTRPHVVPTDFFLCPLGTCHGDQRPGAPSPVCWVRRPSPRHREALRSCRGLGPRGPMGGPRAASTEAVRSGELSPGKVRPAGPGGREAGVAWPHPACDRGVPIPRRSPSFCVSKGGSRTTVRTS